MSVIRSGISPTSETFKSNRRRMLALNDQVAGVAASISEGGPPAARERHQARGKLLPRERIATHIDPGSAFLEVGQFAAHDMYGGDIASGGLITGIGRVEGRLVMVVCNDATVKGGT